MSLPGGNLAASKRLDAVAAVVSIGLPDTAAGWTPIVRPLGYQAQITGVFTVQTPQESFTYKVEAPKHMLNMSRGSFADQRKGTWNLPVCEPPILAVGDAPNRRRKCPEAGGALMSVLGAEQPRCSVVDSSLRRCCWNPEDRS